MGVPWVIQWQGKVLTEFGDFLIPRNTARRPIFNASYLSNCLGLKGYNVLSSSTKTTLFPYQLGNHITLVPCNQVCIISLMQKKSQKTKMRFWTFFFGLVGWIAVILYGIIVLNGLEDLVMLHT